MPAFVTAAVDRAQRLALRGRRRFEWAAFVLVPVTIVGCGGSVPPAPTPTVAPTASVRSVSAADLARIVVAPESPPAGMSHDATGEGVEVLSRVIVSRSGAELAPILTQPGFVAGRYTEFSGEGALLSWAALFDTVANAERAFDVYLDEFSSDEGYGFDTAEDAGLGDEGRCDEGDVVLDRMTGATLFESICLWRSGNAVLAAGGPLDAADLRRVAEGMDARAR